MMIVEYSALYEVDCCSSRALFFEIEFFYSVNEAVEKLREGASECISGDHSPHHNMMIVEYSALYEVDCCSSRVLFFNIEFFYSVNVQGHRR
ncbi:MAG: hypothetical protein PHY62_11735 [Gallionella sp.]|nr:hypothetical protein [Gallionella sp.]